MMGHPLQDDEEYITLELMGVIERHKLSGKPGNS